MRQLRMRRPTLADLPSIDLPTGCALRLCGPADAEALSQTLAPSFPEFPWSPERVSSELLAHPEVYATFAIKSQGRLVATASCKKCDDPEAGYLHWCAVHPGSRGARLGRAVCIAVLERFAQEGLCQAILDTDDHRLPAIRTYLNLGFAPEIRDDEDASRWSQIPS